MPESRSAKAIILASGQGLTTLVSLIIAAVLARTFNKLDYATYRQTLLAYTFVAPFVMLAFQRALFYFMPTEKERPRGVLVENLLLLSAGGLALSLFFLTGGNELLARRFHNPALAETLRILAPYPLLMLPAASLGACLLARDRAKQVAVFNVTSRIGVLLAVLVPCLLWPRWPWPAVAIAATVLAACASTAVALVLMFRACPTGSWRPTLAGVRRQVFYSVPLGLATLATSIDRSLGQVVVAALCPAAAFAVFVNGAMEIPLVRTVTGSITSVLIVDYVKLYREGRISEIIRLVHRAMVKCAMILIPAMVFLLCMAPEVMRLLFGQAYEPSAIPFRLYLLLLPLRTLSFGAILMATGNGRHVLIRSVLVLGVKVVVIWFAVRSFGPNGAAATSVIVLYIIGLPYFLIVLRWVLGYPILRLFPWAQLLKVGVGSAAGTLGILALKQLSVAWPDVVGLTVTGVVYATITLAMFSFFDLLSLSQLWARLRALAGRRSGPGYRE